MGFVLLCQACLASAQETTLGLIPDSARIDQLERTVQSVVEENRRLSQEIDSLKSQTFVATGEEPPAFVSVTRCDPSYCDSDSHANVPYYAGFDNGFFIRPVNAAESPYSLKINHQNTIRYSGFARDATSWIDSAGVTNPIFNSSAAMIPRGRLIFSGNAFLPDMTYLLNIDYNTVSANPIGFRAYALSYKFSRGFQLHLGQNKVPGTREWLVSSWDAQEGPDRSMATTFFRPSLSQGVWITGEPVDGLHYHAMISNGFNTLNIRPTEIGDHTCFSGSTWWEPWGEFGRGYCDIEHHEELVMRIGSSLTSSREEGSQTSDYPENTSIRLSDGTLITQQGALAPGLTVQAFSMTLAAFDVSFKRRGFSLSTELYFQDLSNLQLNGPAPVNSIRAQGGMVQGGYFVVPQRLEFYSRNSYVTGGYGSGTEIGGGFNWFILPGKSNLRFTMDAAWLESSPADQNRTGFVAGQTGLLVRTQINSAF